MTSQTSSMFSEFYLQYIEHTFIVNLLLKFNIEGYFRYVDNILIIYSESSTELTDMLKDLIILTL